MPSRPARPCRVRSCPHKVKGSVPYCPKHSDLAPSGWSNDSDPWYNLSIKKARQMGFNTNWKGNPNAPLKKRGGMRARQLIKNPMCHECKKNGIINDVTSKGKGEVDHVIPFRSANTLKKQMELFEDPDNHRTLCVHHHRIKTAKEETKRMHL